MKETFEQKKARILNNMKAAGQRQTPVNTIDLTRVKRMQNFLADPLKTQIAIFAYKQRYHRVIDQKHERLTAAAVEKYLADGTEKMNLYSLCSEKAMSCPLPSAFIGKNAETIVLKNDEEVLSFILKQSGVMLTKEDL